ncbi:PepSY domain-containing protein [Gordonia sp. (in: high G+C Gram-positive bacteria)]|uniref:PepSY-associated TM helix domain-containing protein n=1 Tax=Gordonia sp. (in: high G+C Gram-positive bacteria) TaxID=84139 RepID=UPI0016A03CC0|nr:PepSY domain-containing protein [Gordonia sp. (in: high G+C Gram-positive bacteria)]NLG47320.1 PepSY domain-containing protein [Gordonia sp. (in: high G+C Gram-positive bacteria)]
MSTSVPSATPKTPPPPRIAPVGPTLTALVRRLHFYAGVLIAPFLLVAAVTGALYALSPTAEQLVYRQQLHTDAQGPATSVAEQVRAAQLVRPDLHLSGVQPATDPGDTTRVLFDDPTLGESERRAVFIDPVTAESRGELVSYGSSGALPLRTWIDRLHRDLHLGDPGRLYSELAASWLWVVALGGVALWVVQIHKRRRATGRGSFLRGVPGLGGRARTVNRHGVIGVWIAIALLFLSATGLTWSTYAGEHVSDLRAAMNWTTPAVDASLTGSPTTAGGEHAGHGSGATGPSADPSLDAVAEIDGALAIARANGVDGAVEVHVPTDDTTAFTVSQRRVSWRAGTSSIAVDPSRDAVVDVNRFDDWPLAAKLSSWGVQLHMGLLFGVANQLLLLAVMAALIVMIILGYRSWWQRRGRARRVGAAPARGTLRSLPRPVGVAIVAGAAAVGWFLPLLGWPLLAFLAIDSAVGRRN